MLRFLQSFLESIKDKYRLYILTSETIQDAPEFSPFLTPIFTKVYSALKIDMRKYDAQIYTFIAKDIAAKPKEILFIDDTAKNLEAAKRLYIKYGFEEYKREGEYL